MSILTTSPLKAAPSAAASVAITSGTSWSAGAWVEVIAATAAPIAIAGVQLSGGSYANDWWELDIGTGPAASEVVVGTLRLYLHNSGMQGSPAGVLLPVPLGGIGSAVRVAVRGRTSRISAGGPAAIALNYYETFSSDQVTTSAQVLTSAPAGAATPTSLTPSATPWANSAWVELLASAATDIGVLGLAHATVEDTINGVEYDLGIGAAGAETVLTTLREAYLLNKFCISWLPGIYPVVAGTRVAVRMRKAGTATTAHPIAVLYYTHVSAAATAIQGSAVFGVDTTVTATRAVAFGLDGETNVHSDAGTLKVFGDVDVTGATTLADVDVSGTTTLAGDLAVTGATVVTGPLIGTQTAGSFTVATGQYALQGARLQLTTTHRATVRGTGRVIISG